MADSPLSRSSNHARVRRDHRPPRTRGGLAAYAVLAAAVPLALAVPAYPVVAAAVLAGVVAGVVGTQVVGRFVRSRARTATTATDPADPATG